MLGTYMDDIIFFNFLQHVLLPNIRSFIRLYNHVEKTTSYFASEEVEQENEQPETCIVCFEVISNNDRITLCGDERHLYHRECAIRHVATQHTSACAVCRTSTGVTTDVCINAVLRVTAERNMYHAMSQIRYRDFVDSYSKFVVNVFLVALIINFYIDCLLSHYTTTEYLHDHVLDTARRVRTYLETHSDIQEGAEHVLDMELSALMQESDRHQSIRHDVATLQNIAYITIVLIALVFKYADEIRLWCRGPRRHLE